MILINSLKNFLYDKAHHIETKQLICTPYQLLTDRSPHENESLPIGISE